MPTISRSSPTTTSAVKEKRRPPLTTLATRLISTTRSWSSSPEAETVRSRVAISRSRVAGLERQPAVTGALGEGLDASVVLVAAAVEHRLLDPGRLGPLGQQRPGSPGLDHARQPAEIGLGPVDRRQRDPGVIVDQLREHAPVGAEHRDPRALGAAADLRPDAPAALEPAGRLGQNGHARLPTFLATYSPS